MLSFSVLATVTTMDPAVIHKPELMSGDAVMVVLTWATFLVLLLVLQKFAWGPILTTLQMREKAVRDSLDKAEQIQRELNDLQQLKARIISEARSEAGVIVEDSRKRAVEKAHIIETQAKEQAKVILEAAQQTIDGEKERLRTVLRKESAMVAVSLAGILFKENLDEAKSNRLIEQYIKEL